MTYLRSVLLGELIVFKCLDLQRSSVDGFSAGLVDDNNLFLWEVLIVGPPDTL